MQAHFVGQLARKPYRQMREQKPVAQCLRVLRDEHRGDVIRRKQNCEAIYALADRTHAIQKPVGVCFGVQ
jgi:hypothetical protein